MLGELDVTRVLREFTTNYTFQRDVPSVSVVLWYCHGKLRVERGTAVEVRQ